MSRSKIISIPLVPLALLLVTFAPFLFRLGFYWDDWAQLLNRHLNGTGSFWLYFSDRPFSAWTHILYMPVMGDANWRWQALCILLRWLSALALGTLLIALWPKNHAQAFMASLIFCVLPVFTQQPISVAYSQHWTQYLLFLLSLLFMTISVRQTRRHFLFTALGLLFQLLHFSITEFFLGTELIRPILLWMLTSQPRPKPGRIQRFTRTMKLWLPYLLILILFVVWRVVVMGFAVGDLKSPALAIGLAAAPGGTILRLAGHITSDLYDVTFGSLLKIFNLQLNVLNPSILLSTATVFLVALLMVVYLTRVFPSLVWSEMPFLWWKQAAPLGLLILVLGFFPLWILDHSMTTLPDSYHADRFALPSMFGLAILGAAIIDWMTSSTQNKLILLAILVGLMSGFQVRNSNEYRWLTIQQQRFYRQLSWRAPMLQPGTALLIEEVIFPFQGIFPTASAVNLLYPPSPAAGRALPYWIYSIRPRYETRNPQAGAASLHTNFRVWVFDGSTDDSIVLANGGEKQNCLWVLGPHDDDNPDISPLLKKWAAISNTGRIQTVAPPGWQPSEDLFGPESASSWCYFFEKADLARQFGDWQSAASLGDQARDAGYSPASPGSNNPFEWLPFIEAYARTGRWEDAGQLALDGFNYDNRYREMLCRRWQQLAVAVPASPADLAIQEEIGSALGCP